MSPSQSQVDQPRMLQKDCGEKSDDSEIMLQNESENESNYIDQTEADDNEQA